MKITIDPESGFCFGVVFAIQMAEAELDESGSLYCLGDIVHNNMEVERLAKKGLKIINHEELKTLEDGNAPTIAKQIKMAFDNDGWFGTDKDALRAAVRAIQSKSEFRKVMVSYQKLYNSSLLGDMQKELKSTEYNEMLYIVSAKPETYNPNAPQQLTMDQLQGWAKRLNAA